MTQTEGVKAAALQAPLNVFEVSFASQNGSRDVEKTKTDSTNHIVLIATLPYPLNDGIDRNRWSSPQS